MKFTKFLRTLFLQTPLLWGLLLAVNSVNQWKHTLKVYAAQKEIIWKLLAVPDFSKVAVAEVFCKKVVLENFTNHRCFSVNFGRIQRTPPVAVSKKQKAETVVWRCSVKKVYLEISLNSQENTCARVSFLQSYTCNFVKIVSETGVFLSSLRTPF